MKNNRDSLKANGIAQYMLAIITEVSRKQEIICRIQEDCQISKCYNKHDVTVMDVLTSVKCLKHGKYDGVTGHCSGHLINVTHKLNALVFCINFMKQC